MKRDMTGWEKWSTGNCAKDWNLTILPNGIIHKPESILVNERPKTLWDFEKQIDYQLLNRRPDLVMIKREKQLYRGPCCPSGTTKWKSKKEKKETST